MRVQQEQQEKIKRKRAADFLKRMDKDDNIRRIREIQEMKKRKIMEKIDKDNQRTLLIQNKKQEMMQLRFELLKELEKQRQTIMDDFEQKKQNNKVGLLLLVFVLMVDSLILRHLPRNTTWMSRQSKVTIYLIPPPLLPTLPLKMKSSDTRLAAL